MHLRDRRLRRKLLSALPYAGDLASLSHPACFDFGPYELGDLPGMVRSVAFGDQFLDSLADHLVRCPPENPLRALVEEGDALKNIDADDRVGRDLHHLGEYVV